jgi:hypothetical protein
LDSLFEADIAGPRARADRLYAVEIEDLSFLRQENEIKVGIKARET